MIVHCMKETGVVQQIFLKRGQMSVLGIHM